MDPLEALADPTRRRIVEMLASGPLGSGVIAGRFHMTAPAVSQHLKALREARLVKVRAEAQRRIYELDRNGVDELAKWIDGIRQFWSAKLGRLEDQLREDR